MNFNQIKEPISREVINRSLCNDFKFDIGDRVITKATHTPGVILKKFNDIMQGKNFITYTIQCRDSSSIMLVSQDNLELDQEYQPIKK